MASPSSPTHGKDAAIIRFRPNGFVGSGLNDGVWATSGYSAGDSTYLEVVIDATGTPDTFKWRQDGGGWTEDVAITGAAQTIADGITITFGATTGHTLNDSFCVGYLKAEACTEAGAVAQITTVADRVLDPNNPPTFTDGGGATVLEIEHAAGKATFTANVGAVTVEGRYIPTAALETVGYLMGWDFTVEMGLADTSRCGQDAKESISGQLGFSGSANAHLIACDTFWDALQDGFDGTQEYTMLKLYGYDPDQDGTGDVWICWCVLAGFSIGTTLGESIKETIQFSGEGAPAFTANS